MKNEKREKPGRPPMDPEKKRKSRTVVVSDEVWKALQDTAEANSCTVGRVIEGMISRRRKK